MKRKLIIFNLITFSLAFNCLGQFDGSDEDGYSEGYFTELVNLGSIYGGGDGSDFGFFVLPITLQSFIGKCGANGNVELAWTTASEINNDHFSLSQSYDTKEWYSLGDITGAGTTNLPHDYSYSYYQEAKKEEVIYFKLDSHDYDGSFHPGKIIAVQCNAVKIDAFPNPVSRSAFVAYSKDDLVVSYHIYNNLGQLVKSGIKQRENVHQLFEIFFEDIEEGIYLLAIQGKESSISLKMIKY